MVVWRQNTCEKNNNLTVYIGYLYKTHLLLARVWWLLTINTENQFMGLLFCFFQEMLNVSKLQRSLTDVRKLFQLSDTEITITLVGFSCFRHIYMHLLGGKQPPTSLSVPATEAQKNDRFPSQEALWWEEETDVSHWRMIRCLSWWRRRLDLAPFLRRARGRLVCCEQKWPKYRWWVLHANKSSCQI